MRKDVLTNSLGFAESNLELNCSGLTTLLKKNVMEKLVLLLQMEEDLYQLRDP
jgi:hypothetical protein